MRFVHWTALPVCLFAVSAIAQNPTPAYEPNQTITLSITFQGPDASKIKSAAWIANLSTKTSASQPNFSTQMIGNGSTRGSTANTFDVSFTVPTNQASGDYRIDVIYGDIFEPLVGIEYHSPTDFSPRMLKINNAESIVRPTIKDVEEVSKP